MSTKKTLYETMKITAISILAAALFFASAANAADITPQKPSIIVICTGDASVATFDGQATVTILIACPTGQPAETQITIARPHSAKREEIKMNAEEANMLSEALELAGPAAEEPGQPQTFPPVNGVSLTITSATGIPTVGIREAPDGPVIAMTSDNALALARILKRAAANAAWLETRAPALMSE